MVALVTGPDGQPNNVWYFWLTGILSSFLDNAPTYLVFFNLAGGDPSALMGAARRHAGGDLLPARCSWAPTPTSATRPISWSRRWSRKSGIRMPSFFGYMAWSCAILLPLFSLITLLFFG